MHRQPAQSYTIRTKISTSGVLGGVQGSSEQENNGLGTCMAAGLPTNRLWQRGFSNWQGQEASVVGRAFGKRGFGRVFPRGFNSWHEQQVDLHETPRKLPKSRMQGLKQGHVDKMEGHFGTSQGFNWNGKKGHETT